MAKNSSAVKALEKALLQLKTQELTMPVVAEEPASKIKADTKATAYLLKESKKFGESLVSF